MMQFFFKLLFICAKIVRKLIAKCYRFSGRYKSQCACLYHQADRCVDMARQAWYDSVNAKLITSKRVDKRVDRKKILFYEITTLRQQDAKTGVQRVVRSILQEWTIRPPSEFDVRPVFASYGRYKYADDSAEDFIDYQEGDVFLSADLNHEIAFACEKFYQTMRQAGVKVLFVVHDLLCICMPEYFFDFAAEKHSRWMRIITQNDGAICVSKAVADEVSEWVRDSVVQRFGDFQVTWFHLGADIQNSVPTRGMPENVDETLNKINSAPSFLMVGTLEPRKAYQQVLNAFELLWKQKIKVNLVFVGKQGWRVKSLIKAIKNHSQLNQHLFWVEGVSDEFLEKIYQVCDCLLAASEGEGFGLPQIEAARHGLPIIARDIPVFHEVTQEQAFFFQGKTPDSLAAAMVVWLTLFKNGQHPSSKHMTWQTWRQSAQQLMSCIISISSG